MEGRSETVRKEKFEKILFNSQLKNTFKKVFEFGSDDLGLCKINKKVYFVSNSDFYTKIWKTSKSKCKIAQLKIKNLCQKNQQKSHTFWHSCAFYADASFLCLIVNLYHAPTWLAFFEVPAASPLERIRTTAFLTNLIGPSFPFFARLLEKESP
jgi:hypothetical protein